ncbi:hypothetical protein [Geotalea uraniireducens]|uniref:Uncharacterized protein n=1 Tax=Geotalea uraniireducens (strain Rf4) TaxID=351605 RepID=A5GE28_GEOUR|nr:hypothetical protein [Geotalea uraniireducens]ABQ25683.1 hypothetical protein Gura_1484 [Geotalea uraniireducens Rf4]
MSSILKALQKAEEEKAARRNAGPLAGDISRVRQERGRKPRWLIPAAMAAVAAVAVLTTFVLMGGFSQRKQETVSQPANNVAAPLSQSRPLSGTPTATAAPLAADNAAAQPLNVQPGPGKNPGAQVATVVSPRPHAAVVAAKAKTPVESAVPAIKKVPEQQDPQTTVAPVSGKHADADFKVSGIAWQKESASRLAVVNGTAVTQGGVVDGARVEAILPDRVRLTLDKRSFEVLLGKTVTEK